jgi:hypothetical protein
VYECHLTYENVDEALEVQLEKLAKQRGWKTSYIVGDPALGPGKRFFLTKHSELLLILADEMKRTVKKSPVPPVREKIESIVHDTKYGVICSVTQFRGA